jgi:uncharacterized lipoprotein YajG
MPITDFLPARSRPIMDVMNLRPNLQSRALRATLAALTATLLLAACAGPSASTSASASSSPALLDAAIAGPQRGDKARARDVYRHPRETLQFFELTPSQSVLEIEPGGGW